MSAPWQLPDLIEQDDDTVIRLSTASWSGSSMEIQLEISTFDSAAKVWQIRCEEVLEHALKSSCASSLELTEDHPLLWKFKHDSASAYFKGTPSNPLAAVGSLYEAHRRAVGEWIDLEACLNTRIAVSELLRNGNGLLAQGPIPLLDEYKTFLIGHGVNVEIVSPYPPGGRLTSSEYQSKLRNESKVLLIDNSFIIGIGWTAIPS